MNAVPNSLRALLSSLPEAILINLPSLVAGIACNLLVLHSSGSFAQLMEAAQQNALGGKGSHLPMMDLQEILSSVVLFAFLALLTVLVSTVCFAATVELIDARLQSRAQSTGEALTAAISGLARSAMPVLAASLLAGLASIPLVIPGIYVGTGLILTYHATQLDRLGTNAALKASWGRMKGRRGFAFLVMLGLGVANLAISYPVQMLTAASSVAVQLAVTGILSSVLGTLGAMIFAAILTGIYRSTPAA